MAEETSRAASAADHPTTGSAKDGPTRAAPAKSSGGGFAFGIILVLVLIGGVIGYVIHTHQNKPPARAIPPISISTTNAVLGQIDESVSGLGTVTPIYTAMISPRVDGQILKVNYAEGQMVNTNDMLAEIDPSPYQAMLTQAEGQLARDKAQLEGAQIDLTRFEDAYGKSFGTNLHAVPKQQVDDQRALVHQDEGTVKYDEGQVANANVQLAYCFIRAPIAGRVGLRLVDPGNIVHAANTNALVVIAQLQPITVVFTVDQKYLPDIQRQLQAGHKMTVEAYAQDWSEKLATGTFLTMDNFIDLGSGTIRIKAQFDNEGMALFPNQFVMAKLIIDTLNDVTLIPTSSIQRNPQGGAFVYVVTNEMVTLTNTTGTVQTNQAKVVMHDIQVGVEGADTSSVEGLPSGTLIATDNFNKLGDDTKVMVRPGGHKGAKGGSPGGHKKGRKKDKPQEDNS